MKTQPVRVEPSSAPPASLLARLRAYLRLIRADRPIGIFLLMWPALWALWIAGNGNPPWRVVLIFVVGVALMRSAGCAINDFADRHFDSQVRRTRDRPLATGLISPAEALGVFAVLILLAFGVVLFLNATTIAMSLVALVLAVIYPFMKRYTHLPQLFLGAAFGWAVPMAFTALGDAVPAIGWWLFAATVLWALIYDTQYAMLDRDDDLRIGVKSTAILFGRWDRMAVLLMQGLLLGLLGWIGLMAGRGALYGVGLALGAALMVYQQYLIRDRSRGGCFQAFLNNNYFGMLVFSGLVFDYRFPGVG